jgi:hypothetical protein
MPWFSLRVIQTEYEITPGHRLTIFRHSIHVDVGGAGWVRPHCFFDTGAAFSIISQSVAQRIGAALTPIPVQHGPIPTFENGVPATPTPSDGLLRWFDPNTNQVIPCLFGELTVRLRNRTTGATSDPLRLVAKVLQGPAVPFNGNFVLLGMHFLAANTGRLQVEAQPWGVGGPGLFFPP